MADAQAWMVMAWWTHLEYSLGMVPSVNATRRKLYMAETAAVSIDCVNIDHRGFFGLHGFASLYDGFFSTS